MKHSNLTAVFSEEAHKLRQKDLDVVIQNGELYVATAFFGEVTAAVDVPQYQERFSDTHVIGHFSQRYKQVAGTAFLETEEELLAHAAKYLQKRNVWQNKNDIANNLPASQIASERCDGHGGPSSPVLSFDI